MKDEFFLNERLVRLANSAESDLINIAAELRVNVDGKLADELWNDVLVPLFKFKVKYLYDFK